MSLLVMSTETKKEMSEIIYITDKSGEKIPCKKDGEIYVSHNFPGNRVEQVVNFKLRDDDVLIAGWVRSGTHWFWEMISMMANKKAETIPKFKEQLMFEYESISNLDQLPSPRILNTHLNFRFLPEDMKTKTIKVIYLLRDPRDAITSWFKTYVIDGYKGSFTNWLSLNLEGKLDWGNWFNHVQSWEKAVESHPNLKVHYLHYEKVLKDPVGEMRKVKGFLGYQVDDKQLHEIVEKCQIDRMRQDKNPFEMNKDAIHYNIGKSGSWKSVFTVEQCELFEKMYREKMAGSKFEQLYRGPVDIL